MNLYNFFIDPFIAIYFKLTVELNTLSLILGGIKKY